MYNLKVFFKKYIIFKFFFLKILKKKYIISFFNINFRFYFWKFESRIDFFLIRNGFVRNFNQSTFILKNKGVYINGNLNSKNYFKISLLDNIQITYNYLLFFKIIFFKKNSSSSFFFNLLIKKKYPFYLEKNYNINSCIIFLKPSPNNLYLNKSILNFNFFFYKYLFYFIKKKTF
jgi:hypothetical protein